MSREEILAKMHEHIKRLGELLDHLDKVLPEHKEKLEGSP